MGDSTRQKTNLGRGLSTLLGELEYDDVLASKESQHCVPIEMIRPNPMQPRKDFNEKELEKLTASIREKGIVQPIIVKLDPENSPENSENYMIVAGERRWRAAQRAQLHEVPVVVREMSESECLEIGLVENIQRTDLNPIEEAQAFRLLMDKFSYTQEKLSKIVGQSRSSIANSLRLLNLPTSVQDHVRSGQLSAGHARTILASPNPQELAQKAIDKELSVRQTEDMVKRANQQKPVGNQHIPRKDANTRIMEAALSAGLKTKVKISYSNKTGAGQIILRFSDLDKFKELHDILQNKCAGN